MATSLLTDQGIDAPATADPDVEVNVPQHSKDGQYVVGRHHPRRLALIIRTGELIPWRAGGRFRFLASMADVFDPSATGRSDSCGRRDIP
ncbi:hypothetical protein GCM10010345_58340 [Streptomyces canarius]|uniref:Uncharacterized protein n=1 Tax=Streptomyces canarius TaxID=285453 RepID=A0ABQ3CVS4_9ACTN|nr:hypothetical protein GCM10010345_58340 [Streptomyces canarius]